MQSGLFWLNDKQWHALCRICRVACRDPSAAMIGASSVASFTCCTGGGRWRDCPRDYGPYTTIYNRFNRWAKADRWRAIFEALAKPGKGAIVLSLDSTSIKAHRSASGGKGGSTPKPSARSALPPGRSSSDAGSGCRHRRRARCSCASTAHACADRRQRLRRRCIARKDHQTRHDACHSQQSQSCRSAPLRRARLQGRERHRTQLLPSQRLPPRCNALRQTGPEFHGWSSNRRPRRLLA